MSDEQTKMVRKKLEQYLALLVKINPGTAGVYWREAMDQVLIGLPIEIEDEGYWQAMMLHWKITDLASDAALEESESSQIGSPEHRRIVQREVCNTLIEVFKTALLVHSLNIKKSIHIQLGVKLMMLAKNPESPIGVSLVALRVLLDLCACPKLSEAIMIAIKESELSGETDHFRYVFDNEILSFSSLAYGLYVGLETPSDASDQYSTELFGLREFQIKSMTEGEEF